MARTKDFSPSELDRLVDDLNRDGCCILREAVDRDLIDEWAAAFDRLFLARQQREGGLAPREQNRYYLTLPWVAPFASPSVFANPAVIGVLDRVFPQEYAMVQLGVDVPVKGSDYQEIHRDYRPLFTDDVVTPLYALAVNTSLVDVTEANGPFQQALGTHVMRRDEALEKVNRGEIPMQSLPLNRGDIMIRTPLALHRGTPNITDTPRPMVVMGYVMHWLHTPQIDLKVPRDFYESLPKKVRTMLRCEVVDEVCDESPETYVNFKY